jgi:hypothetical protein
MHTQDECTGPVGIDIDTIRKNVPPHPPAQPVGITVVCPECQKMWQGIIERDGKPVDEPKWNPAPSRPQATQAFTIRDQFAMMALNAVLADRLALRRSELGASQEDVREPYDLEQIARQSYEVADAMLAARSLVR